MTELKTWYVGKGVVTCPDVADTFGVELGADEWQFSDGPYGERGYSEDYPTLEAGMRALSPAIFIMEPETGETAMRAALLRTATQLDDWADETVRGGWSTHQVQPMRVYAAKLRKIAGEG